MTFKKILIAIAKVLLGSVAVGVFHHAPCPVLMVNAQ